MAQTFFQLANEVSFYSGSGGFYDCDCSPYIPAGSTGVVVRFWNSIAGAVGYGLRKNGSTDNRTGNVVALGQGYAVIGVDSSRIFEAAGAGVYFYLTGFTNSGATFFTNAYDKSLTTYTAWTDIDCSAVAPSATGLIFEHNTVGFLNFGMRKNGSTDNRITDSSSHMPFCIISGCDSGQIVEGYAETANVDFFLVGYITSGVTFNTNATDVSLTSTGAWIDLPALGAGASMGIIETTVGADIHGLRTNGSSVDTYKDTKHAWCPVFCDSGGLIEGKIGNLTDDFFLVATTGAATAHSQPVVTTQAASSVAATTATLNGNVTVLGSPSPTQHGHVLATFPTPTTTNFDFLYANGVVSATGAYTSSATGLTQNTLYYCRAYVVNSLGTFYGNQVQFTTSAGVPVLTTIQPSKIFNTTATGSGSIDNDGGSAITAHGVCWALTANPTTSDSKTDDGAGTPGTFVTQMTGMTAITTYHVRAYATNTTGTGYGSDLTFTTAIDGVPVVTTEVSTNMAGTSATGNGTLVYIGDSAVTEHGHCWGTSVNPTIADNTTTLGALTSGAFTSEITGLTAGTTYYVRAYATNAVGTGYGDNDTLNENVGAITRPLAVLGEHLVYISENNVQRAILGAEF